MGFADGGNGQYQRNLSKDIQDCAKFNLTVDQAGYVKGWHAGVRQFCTPGRAYQLGTQGQTYNNVCPSDLANSFNSSWHKGLRKYCVPETGYNLGHAGKPMPPFCSPDLNVAFRNAYDEGHRIYGAISSIQSQINGVNDQIGNANRAIRRKRNDIRKWQNVLSGNGKPVDPATRRLARQNIRNDNDAIYYQQNRLNRLTRQRDSLQRQLNREQTQ